MGSSCEEQPRRCSEPAVNDHRPNIICDLGVSAWQGEAAAGFAQARMSISGEIPSVIELTVAALAESTFITRPLCR
jgi:hypothetical protein